MKPSRVNGNKKDEDFQLSLQKKRSVANRRERQRVEKINQAFALLKKRIPFCDSRLLRTKIDVLKYAIEYIRILRIMLRANDGSGSIASFSSIV